MLARRVRGGAIRTGTGVSVSSSRTSLLKTAAQHDALVEQAQLERRIATLQARLTAARIAEPNRDGSAGIGSSVRLRDLETSELFEYELVGAIEGDVGQGRVSVEAPVGRALGPVKANARLASGLPLNSSNSGIDEACSQKVAAGSTSCSRAPRSDRVSSR